MQRMTARRTHGATGARPVHFGRPGFLDAARRVLADLTFHDAGTVTRAARILKARGRSRAERARARLILQVIS